MHLPIIKKENRYKKSMISFGGLNLTQNYAEGEMLDCSGISHIKFPAITQRQKSEQVFGCNSPTALMFGNKECIATGDALYYDRKKVGDLSPGQKQIAFLGDKIFVFPDKVYYDTAAEKFGDMQGECNTGGATVTFSANSISVPESMFKETREIQTSTFRSDAMIITYSEAYISNGKVVLREFALKHISQLQEGTFFCEKCEKNQYRIVSGIELSEDSQTYSVTSELVSVKNILEDIFSELQVGDVVEISGCATAANNRSAAITEKSETSLTFADGTFNSASESENITIKRKIPDFTCVCSYENRLWGCEGNSIYASALGDAANFFIYNNLSTDSFTVESNTAGEFTACVAYGNCCLFFKEHVCYKLYGNRPANFQLTESFAGGILKSDNRSIACANGIVIYKGCGGIYAYGGGSAQCISQKLEGVSLSNAVAGTDSKRYYITADTKDGREEFVWDFERNLWSKSNVSNALGYAFYGGNMYRLTESGVEKISEEADDGAEWSVTFCPFDEGYYKTKNYSRLHIALQLFERSYLHVEISCDGEAWRTIDTYREESERFVNLPCVIKSCHEVRLRLSGKGKSVIRSITREFSVN